MDINKVLMEYDSMFGVNSREETEAFLLEMIRKADEEGDDYSVITLENEIIGFYRDTSQKDKSLNFCRLVIERMKKIGIEGTVEYATSLINAANAYRAFGLYEQSLELYREVECIYMDKLPYGSFNYASMYNNWSLLYQEMGDFENARLMLMKALAVVDLFPKAVIPQANTRTNLAVTLLRISQGQKGSEGADTFKEAVKYLDEALSIYEKDGGKDFHYSGALSAKADALYMTGAYAQAAGYYQRAMQALYGYVGRTEAYERIEENYNDAVERAGQAGQLKPVCGSNLERCKSFYEMYGAPMIHQQFGEYEKRIAVGLVGEGSDCFGFDDDISTDHDYGVGFCMWLTDEDYDRIGDSLQKAYEKLIVDYVSDGRSVNRFMDERRGVFRINVFYEDILGVGVGTEGLTMEQWLSVPEDRLATAVNGMVFCDDAGVFSDMRKKLQAYYPRKVWLLRIAEKLHDFSQYAQSNYARMMARQDYVTAQLCVAGGIKSAMETAYLLNRTYAPYYKWQKKAMDKLNVLKEIIPLLEKIALAGSQEKSWQDVDYSPYAINEADLIAYTFEEVAGCILKELNNQGIVQGTDTFLDVYFDGMVKKAMEITENSDTHNMLVQRIVDIEWQQFDKVENENGRADCQDDWDTFSIMRKSQYMTWPDELLESFLTDLEEADKKGWNLIAEKYARMMESTAPDRYAELEEQLLHLDDDRVAIQEEIIKLQVSWMEEFASAYPKMASNARSIHTYEDNPYNTSYETYLRGELGTYSARTLLLYGRFVVSLHKQGKNLAYMIMENTAKLYGYKSVEDAEVRL